MAVEGFDGFRGGESSALEEGDSSLDSDDLGASMPDPRSAFGEGAGAGSSAGRDNVLRSSLVSANTAIRVPTFTPFDPASCCHPIILSTSPQMQLGCERSTVIFAIIPSSCASTSIWALSVSISKRTSPVEKDSPARSKISTIQRFDS